MVFALKELTEKLDINYKPLERYVNTSMRKEAQVVVDAEREQRDSWRR